MTSKPNKLSANNKDQNRVPCRGCLPSCQYYSICDGKPWRLSEEDYMSRLNDNKDSKK